MISVIVASFNGEKRIPKLLKSILQQTVIPDEVVVVLDGSTDNSEKIIENFSGSLNIRLIKQHNLGRAGARNTGLLNAKGDMLVFIDDDMELLPNCIEEHVTTMSQVGEAIIVGTQEEIQPEDNDAFQQYKYELFKKWNNQIPAFPKELAESQIYITTANCSFTSSVVKKAGYFPDKLKDGEDFAWAFKAKVNGVKIFYQPSARALHYHGLDSFLYFIRRSRDYYNADYIMLEKIYQEYPQQFQKFNHPRLNRFYERKAGTFFIKKLLHWPFAFKFWIKVFDSKSFNSFYAGNHRSANRLIEKVTVAFVVYFPSKAIK